MKILFYGATELEIPMIKKWSRKNDIPVTYLPEEINRQNIQLAKAYDGICFYPSKQMQAQAEDFYQQLADNGIKYLSLKSTGIDGLNAKLISQYGFHVTNVPQYSPTSVGHFALMSILTLLRNIPSYYTSQPLQLPLRKSLLGRELSEVTVGVLGTGRIGSVVAKGVLELGGKVIACSRSVNPELQSVVPYVSFAQLLRNSDIISIHVPLTSNTKYLFSDEAFQMAKPGLMLVNTARGSIVNTNALLSALQQRIVRGAVLDTVENENTYFDIGWHKNPYCQALAKFNNVLLTPHIAYFTNQAVQEITETSLDNVRDMIMNAKTPNLVFGKG